MNFIASDDDIIDSFQPKALDLKGVKVESYVYVIRKKMRPYVDSPKELNLIKVGTGSLFRGSARLSELQTSLIGFDLLRIYLFPPFGEGGKKKSEKADTYGRKGEQRLHDLIEEHFKPAKVRIMFPSLKAPSEWFHIEPQKEQKFLNFLDESAFYDIEVPPVYGSEFTKRDRKKIEPEKFLKTRKQKSLTERGIGIRIVEHPENKTKDKVMKEVFRKSESALARTLRARKKTDVIDATKKAQKKEDQANRKKLHKSVAEWRDIFFDKRFRDKELSKKYELVFYDAKQSKEEPYYIDNKGSVKQPPLQPLIYYWPYLRKTRFDKLVEENEDEFEKNSGFLTVNEALGQIPSLKQKYKDSYDYFVRLNNFKEGYDYQGVEGL